MLWGHSQKHQTLSNFLQILQNLHSSFTSISCWQILERLLPSFPCHALARAFLSRSHLRGRERGRCQKVCFIFFDSCVNIFARSCLRNVCEEMSKVKIFQALYSPTHTPLPPRAHTLGTYLSKSIELSVCCLHQAETKRLAICLVALIMSNKNV